MQGARPSLFVGVDVSSRWLDVALGPDGPLHRFPNPSGIPDLLRFLPPGSVVGVEATGSYHRPLAYALHRAGFPVYVLQPLSVASYARSLLRRAKTDRADARLIARFLSERVHELPPYEPSPDSLTLLSVLVRLEAGLTSDRVALLNRLHAWSYVLPSLSDLEGIPDRIQGIAREVRSRALEVVRSDPLLSGWFSALLSLPGVGEAIALRILAYSGDMRRFSSARAYAAFTGLTPRLHQSGQSPERGHISRVGPPPLRGAFYMAALSAYRSDPDRRAFVEALLARGKPKRLALVALANRLARAAWSVCVRAEVGGS